MYFLSFETRIIKKFKIKNIKREIFIRRRGVSGKNQTFPDKKL